MYTETLCNGYDQSYITESSMPLNERDTLHKSDIDQHALAMGNFKSRCARLNHLLINPGHSMDWDKHVIVHVDRDFQPSDARELKNSGRGRPINDCWFRCENFPHILK